MHPATLSTKRWDEPIEPTDGTRILITRYRPRALPKDQETWGEWLVELAPSPVLLAAFQGKSAPAIAWSTYRATYLREMLAHKPLIASLAERLRRGEALTLLCSSQCVRESRCHRSILRELITAELARGS